MATRSDWGDTKLVSAGAKQRRPGPRLVDEGSLDPEEAEKAIRGLETPETVGTPAQRWRELRAPPSVIEAGFLLAAYVVKLQEVWDELPTVPEPTVAGDPPSEP